MTHTRGGVGGSEGWQRKRGSTTQPYAKDTYVNAYKRAACLYLCACAWGKVHLDPLLYWLNGKLWLHILFIFT